MFTGITQGCYPVVSCAHHTDRLDYTVQFPSGLCKKLRVGHSVSINGVCQTVTACENARVSFQAISATLQCTTLNTLKVGDNVSVERSLRVGDEVGGHFLSGHIIGTGDIIRRHPSDSSLTLTIQCAPTWMKYCVPKGFIALDGSSLTLGNCDMTQACVDVHLIPETLKCTLFAQKQLGDRVNIEIDYVTQLTIQAAERYLANISLK